MAVENRTAFSNKDKNRVNDLGVNGVESLSFFPMLELEVPMSIASSSAWSLLPTWRELQAALQTANLSTSVPVPSATLLHTVCIALPWS